MSAVASLQPVTLAQWLAWQEQLHPRTIDLGLERVGAVADRMGLRPLPARVLTVAGTNGKGSCALLCEALLAGKHRVGTYTSPYLLRYNERVRLDGREVSDDELCAAFAAVDAARGDTSLTYFEFGTLAALWLFRRAAVDIAVLEVGMGGRLDAVNILDPEVAVITSIGIDHGDWLGWDRESIGGEKAGIFRPGVPAVCADRDPPASIADRARALGAPLAQIGADFDIRVVPDAWHWRIGDNTGWRLPAFEHILPDNLAAALAAVHALGEMPDAQEIAARLATFAVPGRRQIIPGAVPVVLDVAHNAEAAAVLAAWLAARTVAGRTHLVLAMLAGKPVAGTAAALAPVVDYWYAAGLPGIARGLSAAAVAAQLPAAGVYDDPGAALRAARNAAAPGDRVVVCGSFYTVAAALTVLQAEA